MTITSTLAVALAAATIAAPASAQPADSNDPVARSPVTQDLRSADARDAARTSSLAGTTAPKQDLRSPDARDAAADQPPVNAPGAPAVDSGTRPAPSPAPVPAGGDRIDWAPIGLGLAGAVFGIAGLGVLAVRRTRLPRVPV
jgi:hypothetical protein